MMEIRNLTKRYGRRLAVDDLSFTVQPGAITGFLGPNGAGKTTTLRIALGLAAATSGEALIEGRPYTSLRYPMHRVGALVDANAVHAGRSAFDHLYAMALTNNIRRGRVTEVLEQVGLAGVARRKVGEFSFGMKQRLGIALALLGDPAVLLLDEPVNGLDPEGIRWLRGLLRSLAAEGRTVLVSSHLMSEMELTADRLVIIARGRLVDETSPAELAVRFRRGVRVRSPQTAKFTGILESAGAAAVDEPAGAILVTGMHVEEIAALAARHGVPIHEMTPRGATLEEAYMELTAGSGEHLTAAGSR